MSSLPPDPWIVLGVEKTADKSEIRTAYRKLVLKCHPDKVQDPALKAKKQDEFQKVQQAYELLNDDTERAKYEEQVKLAAMKAAMLSKNMPNISASRTPPRSSYTFYEVRSAEPKFKHSSSRHASPVRPSKMYTHHTSATKSYEEDVSPRSQALYDEDKRARRMASSELPSRRDDEKREERRRREARDREEDERRERERREKELRKQDRKDREKVRDKEKRRDVEDKTSRRAKAVYVEEYEREDVREVYPTSAKVEKKKAAPSSSSSSKKLDEPRAKSSSRREREESPRTRVDKTDPDYRDALEYAASYMERQRAKSSKPAPLPRAQTFQEPSTYRVPSPPAEVIDDDVRRSMARPSRRASNDLPVRSKERLSTSHKKSREGIEVVETLPRGDRIVPVLQKSYSMPPPIVPESPPRHPVRVNTAPQEVYSRPSPAPPAFTRTGTWAAGDTAADRYPDTIRGVYEESDDERYDDRRRHRSRRTQSPEPVTRRYKTSGGSGIKVVPVVEPQYEPAYDHHEAHRSSRKHSSSSYAPKVVDTGRAEYYYAEADAAPFPKVKTSRVYTTDDVTFSRYQPAPAQGSWGVAA